MNDWERAICARVKTVRESIRWSQSAFAEQLGITRDQLASIEYGRTPLRYDIAWRLHLAFGISLDWLEKGLGFPDRLAQDCLPIPTATGLPRRALLSEVVPQFHSPPNVDAIALKAGELLAQMTEPERRSLDASLLNMVIESWIARLPDGHVDGFIDAMLKAGEHLVKSLPKEPAPVVNGRAGEMAWARIRTASARKILAAPEFHKKMLTGAATSAKVPLVKSQLDNLVATLNRLAGKRGKKTELARFLGAPLASVSRWLSGDRVPGADTTLKMLNWVQQQERK